MNDNLGGEDLFNNVDAAEGSSVEDQSTPSEILPIGRGVADESDLFSVTSSQFDTLSDAEMDLFTIPTMDDVGNPVEYLKLTSELLQLLPRFIALKASEALADKVELMKVTARAMEIQRLLGKSASTESEPNNQDVDPAPDTSAFFEFNPDIKPSARQKANKSAISLLADIKLGRVDGSKLTEEQKTALAKYSGNGGGMIGADGLSGSAYEYYTPKPLAEGVWSLLDSMGFAGGKVLDPAAGTGIFGATSPKNAVIDAIELDETSGMVNKLVNGSPKNNVTISAFESIAANTPDETYDAIVTNVPFGDNAARGKEKLKDPRYQSESLEAYFILRSLEKLRPNGLACFVTSKAFVSNPSESKLRYKTSLKAEFMGAYRLPNKMFDAAGADVTTDVIVFRKYSNDAREKIEELAQQNPDKLHECKVLWDEFLVGGYFKGDGLHNVLGRTEMGRGRFGDVEKVVSDDSIANISKLLKRLPDSRIDWAGLNAAPTTAIQYQDGDSIAVAGRTMTYKNGVFVQDPPSEKDAEIVQIGENLFSPLQAVNTEAKWEDAVRFNKALQDKADYKNIPLWIKITVQNISSAIPEADRSAVFDVLKTAFALQDVVNQHVTEEPFNYAEVYPQLSTAIRLNVKHAKKIPATVPKQVREVASLLGIWYITKTQSFRDRWNGTSLSEVVINELRPTQKYERAKYEMADDSGFVPLDHLTEVMGEGFDPLESDEWCVSSDGKGVMSSDDFYSGNYAEFLERNRQDIASIGDPVLREKLVRQRQNAQDRLVKTDISALTIDLNSPLVSIERKVEFLRKYVHSGFSVLANGDTPEIAFDGKKTKGMSDNDLRNMKRFADYLKRGVLSTLTSEAEIAANRDIDKVRIERLKKLITSTNQKFDAWCKSNTGVQDGLRRQFDNPKNIYFKEVDDNSPLEIDGLNPAFQPHDYQNGAIRRYAKRMSGILGFDVGLGKTFTSLATIQHVQSIGVKKKTIFAVPNAVLTNWRKEATACYKSTDDCLFVGLDVDANGVGTLNSSNYARDLNTILENKHRKIFVTYEALGMIPMREGTIEEYERHLSLVDQSYNSSDTKSKSASIIKEGKLKGVTDAGAKGSEAVPFFEDMGIDSIVVDEGHCFPAGTLVDGIPIEKLKIGDMVRSLNHETGAVEFRKITDAMSRQAPSMVCVTLLDGQEIYCTHNHPFFTKDRGYVKAENLSVDDVVLKSKCNHEKTQTNGAMQPMLIGIPALARSGGESERRDQGVLHEEMLRTGIAGQDADPSTVRGVCDGVRVKPHSELEVREGSCDELFLLKVLPNIEHASNISANGDVEKESRECECRTQRNDGAWQLAANASGGGEEQVDENFARNSQGQAVKSSGRERATSIGGAFDAVEGVGFSMASGVRGENKDAERERIPVMLQARSGESVNSSRDRGGREVSLFESGSDEGFKEDGVFVGVGVASVAFLERGSDGRFGGVCGDGLVYDITVDGNHNFFAEGILVHNCFKNSKETVEFKAAKFLSDPATSNRGLDMQMKTWYIRGKSKLNDGALILTATPITNSPLEIYSMLTLAIGEDEVNRRMGGVRGSDAFMQTFCSIGEEEVVSLAGVERLQRVFTGLQNTNLLRSMLNQVANIKSARQVDLKIPDAEEISTSVELPASDVKELQRMQAIYSAASKMARGKDVLPQEEQMVLAYQEISREPIDLIGHPFNFINKVSKLIADPELARQTTVYVFGTAQAELANKVVTEFNAKKFTEERNRPSLAQDQASIISRKIKKSGADSGENDVEVLKVLIVAKIVGEKIVIDTEDIDTQNKFLKIAEKSKLNLDVTISPKLAVFLENFKQEDASPRGKGKAKQLIFCDMLSLHNKIKILLKNRCGIDPSKIIIVNGVTISDAADMQDTQDGFNAEGDENRYRVVIANKKAEVGVNYQKGTQAIHHLTVGWTPDSIHQRNGRGVRQGNYVGKVTIYHYDADGTFDEYKRGIVSKKADWIGELVSDEGGNSVKIAGGISNSDIKMLAEAAGSAEGMRKVREKIANREMVERKRAAKDALTSNLEIMLSQVEIISKYKTVNYFAAEKVADAAEAYQALKSAKERKSIIGDSDDPKAIARADDNLAKAQANYDRVSADVVAGMSFSNKTMIEHFESYGWLISARGSNVRNVVDREQIISDVSTRPNIYVINQDSSIADEYSQELSVAESLARDSEAKARSYCNDAGVSVGRIEEAKSGAAKIIRGQIVGTGDFVIDNKDRLHIVKDGENSSLAFFDEEKKRFFISDSEVVFSGLIVTQEHPDQTVYFDTVRRAAAVDDAIIDENGGGLPPEATKNLYSASNIDVRNALKAQVKIKVLADKVVIPSPKYPYILPDDADKSIPIIKSIYDEQAQYFTPTEADYGSLKYVLVEDGIDLRDHYDSASSATKIQMLCKYAVAHEFKINSASIRSVVGFVVQGGLLIYLRDAVAQISGSIPESATLPLIQAATTEDELKSTIKALYVDKYPLIDWTDEALSGSIETFYSYGTKSAIANKIRALNAPPPVVTPTEAEPSPKVQEDASAISSGTVTELSPADSEYVAIIGNTYVMNKEENLRTLASGIDEKIGFKGAKRVAPWDQETVSKLPNAPVNSWVASRKFYYWLLENRAESVKKYNISIA